MAENIADNGGLNTAYLAYQTSRGGKSVERLQGLEQLSPEALFFVNFGRFWCGKSRPENAEYLVRIVGMCTRSYANTNANFV